MDTQADKFIRLKSPTAKEVLSNSQYTFSIKLNLVGDDDNQFDVREVEGDIEKLMTLAAFTFGFLDYHCSKEHGITEM